MPLLEKDDFLFSFDLKSGYHHVDICREHWKYLGVSWGVSIIRASVDALCRDGPGEISRDRLQRGRLTREETTSLASKAHRYDSQTHL